MNYYQQCRQCVPQMIDTGNLNALDTQMIQENNNANPFCPEKAFMLGNFFSSLYVPYCGWTNFTICPQNSRQQALARLMMLEFNMHELNLYLDTHPDDKQALDRFHEFHHEVMQARDEFSRQYGPLSILDVHDSEIPWSWNNEPWPWQRQ